MSYCSASKQAIDPKKVLECHTVLLLGKVWPCKTAYQDPSTLNRLRVFHAYLLVLFSTKALRIFSRFPSICLVCFSK
jgi:hypothetical protein